MRLIDQSGGAFDRDGARRHDADSQADVLQRKPTSNQRLQRAGRGRSIGDQQRVYPAVEVEILLQPPKRNEHGPDVGLLRLQRELAQIRRSEDRAYGEAHRAAEIVFAPVQRFDRNCRRPLDAHEHAAARGGADVGRERAAEQRLASIGPARAGNSMKPPETIVDTVHLDARPTAAAPLLGHDALHDDHGTDRVERR